MWPVLVLLNALTDVCKCEISVRKCACILVYLFVLYSCYFSMFVITEQSTCELKNVEFLVGFVPYCDVRFEICDADLWGDSATPSTPRCTAIKFVCTIFLRHIISYNVNPFEL